MGRSLIVPYVIEFTDNGRSAMQSRVDGKRVHTMMWNSKYSGRPTSANLEKYMYRYGKGLEPGGTNEHISKSLGHIPYPTWARIVGQTGKHRGVVVAEWNPGPFVAW
jgi:hypothetical protein